MDRRSAMVLAGFILAPIILGGAGALVTADAVGSWYADAPKPPGTPPPWVFGPVWTTLYILMGVSAWRAWRTPQSDARTQGLVGWGTQLGLNAVWTPLFFGLRAPGLALVDIVLLLGAIGFTMHRFHQVDRPASLLLIPYLAWVTYATYLNAGFLWLV